jgi:hypothetical protein
VPAVNAVGTVLEDKAWTTDSSGNLVALRLNSGEILSTSHIPELNMIVRNTSLDEAVVIVNSGGLVGSYIAK